MRTNRDGSPANPIRSRQHRGRLIVVINRHPVGAKFTLMESRAVNLKPERTVSTPPKGEENTGEGVFRESDPSLVCADTSWVNIHNYSNKTHGMLEYTHPDNHLLTSETRWWHTHTSGYWPQRWFYQSIPIIQALEAVCFS